MAARLIDLPFTRGLDESTDETVLAPPGMTELVNYHLTRAGRLEHRLGVSEVSLSTVVANSVGDRPDGNKVQALHGRFVAAGGHGYLNVGNGAWSCAGSVSRFVPFDSYQGMQQTAESFAGLTCCSVNGFLVVAGTKETNVVRTKVRVYDERTGVRVFEGDLSGGATNCVRVVASGNFAVILRMNLATGELVGCKLDLTTFPLAGFTADVSIVTATATGGFDAAQFDPATNVLISYYDGTNAVVATVATATLAITDSATVTDGAGVKLTTCHTIQTQPTVYLSWLNLTTRNLIVAVFNSALTQIGANQVVAAVPGTAFSTDDFHPVIGIRDVDNAVIGWTDSYLNAPYQTFRTTFRDISRLAALGTTYGPVYGYGLASKPFRANTALPFVETLSQPAVWLVNHNPNTTELDRSYFLMLLGLFSRETNMGACSWELSACPSGAVPVTNLLGASRQVPEVVLSTDGESLWQTALQEAFRGLGTSTLQRSGKVHRFGDGAITNRARTRCVVPCQGSFAVLGGAARYFSGDRLIELGIAHGPTVVVGTPTGGGAMTPAAVYRYVFVIEMFDGFGQRHLSYVTSPYSVTMGGADTQVVFDILIPGMWALPNTTTGNAAVGVERVRSVTIRAYRTAGNVGTVFRYAPSVTSPNGMLAGPITDFGRVTYNDTNADSAIAGNEAVYVQVGNARSNYRAPPCRFGCEHEGRLVTAGGWGTDRFIVSKLFFPGEGIKFADSVAFEGVSPEPITGVASLDGSLVVFAERGIYIVNGDGPTDDGVGSFSSPRKLPGRVGCIDWRSIVTTEAGIFFRSADGLYLLPRGLAAPQFVGAAIKGKLRLFPETLGAATVTRTVSLDVSDHDSEQVLAWLVGNAEEPTAVKIFMFSLATQTWSEVALPADAANLQNVIGVWQDLTNGTDVLGFVRKTLASATAGSILVENPATNYDRDIDGSFEPLLNGSWKTGKVFPFGFGGRGTIRALRLVGDCLHATTLAPTVYTDANAAGYASSVLTFAAGRFAVEIPLRQKDIEWLQVGVADPTTGSANRGAGLRFNGLALEVEMDPGLIRSPPTTRSI